MSDVQIIASDRYTTVLPNIGIGVDGGVQRWRE